MPSSQHTERWMWTAFRNGQPGQAGDLANNFRNEGRDPDPGVFARDPIPNTARFLAREFIQNTVDASRDPVFVNNHGVGPVEVIFRFVELTGEARAKFIEVASLDELADRLPHLKSTAAARSSRSCLASLDGDAPIRLLYAEEHGASGMYGPWDDDLGTSKMSIALLSGNVSDKPANAGGSFGHGKSVNAMASRIRLNFAYTCFSPGSEEPDISRRLLGVAYWPEHKVDGRRYWGFGLLGAAQSDGADAKVVPWTNDVADELASTLGFSSRSHQHRDQCGTSLLIVDPDLEPADLLRAVERYWWPAISDANLRVKVIDYQGTERPARPKQDQTLKVFDTAYRAIKTPSGQSDDKVRVREASRVESLGIRSGVIGMCPAPVLPDDALVERQTSLVAYTRGLGMVVKYRSLPIGPVFVNGVFVANDEGAVEQLLVKSEPKTHYDWLERPDGVEPEDQESIRLLVQNINDSVRREVREYSKHLTPPQTEESYKFRDLDRDLRELIRGSDENTIVEPSVRDFSIRRLKVEKFAVGLDQLKVRGTVRVARLDERISHCKVTIKYYLPDDASRGKPIPLEIEAPEHFVPSEDDPMSLVGPIDEAPLDFKWATPPYDRDWEGDLDVEVTTSGS